MERTIYRDSGAFDVEYRKRFPANAIRKDLESYIGEYRFQIPRYDYELVYSNGHLRDIDENEPMIDKTNRAIKKRQALWKSTHREIAEYKGIDHLDKSLDDVQLGDIILWASPPGSKEDGYGDYGYIFRGIVDKLDHNDKHITMSALRVEETDINAYSIALNQIVGSENNFGNADDFLANPFVVHSVKQDPERVLTNMFRYQSQTDNKFRLSMSILEPLINDFINAVKQGLSTDELRRIFYSIENLALSIKENTLNTDFYSLIRTISKDPNAIILQYGSYRAPIASGSCGDTGKKSSNIFGESNFITELLGEDIEPFECPSCKVVIHELVKGDACPRCGYTKAEHIASGAEAC